MKYERVEEKKKWESNGLENPSQMFKAPQMFWSLHGVWKII